MNDAAELDAEACEVSRHTCDAIPELCVRDCGGARSLAPVHGKVQRALVLIGDTVTVSCCRKLGLPQFV